MDIRESIALYYEWRDYVNGMMTNVVNCATSTWGGIMDSLQPIYYDPCYYKAPAWTRARIHSHINGWLAAIWHTHTRQEVTGKRVWRKTLLTYVEPREGA